MRPDLLRWQRDGYAQFHASRLNLWIHAPAVLGFIASSVVLVIALASARWPLAGLALVGLIVAFALQGIGHKREVNPPIPFAGPIDAVTRILAEQFITFPWFLVSGRWWAALATGPRS